MGWLRRFGRGLLFRSEYHGGSAAVLVFLGLAFPVMVGVALSFHHPHWMTAGMVVAGVVWALMVVGWWLATAPDPEGKR